MTLETLGKGFAVTLAALFMVACSTTSDTTGVGNVDTTADQVVEPIDNVESDEERAAREARERAEADRLARQTRTVYFDFDESTVKSEYQDLLRAHAVYLSNNAGTQVVVEGHCDERGTPEYNLALGERRGKSIKDILVSYGVRSSQIRVVSYGEENPTDPAHNESAWERNRRAVLVYEG